jgi:hypothetical protein
MRLQVGWVPYMAVMPKIHPSQRAKIAGFTSFVEAVAGYGANAAGYGVGEQYISTDVAFISMVVLNVIAIPLGTLSMQPRPGCTAPDNLNRQKNQRAKAARAASGRQASEDAADLAAMQLPCAQRVESFFVRYRQRVGLALKEFLSAFWTCRAYRLMFLRGFIGSLNPFGIFG